MTRRRWVALPPQISLRARNSTAGMGACTCGHRDGLLEGFGELEQPATGSKQCRGPLPVKIPDPQVPLRTVCFPSGPGQSSPQRRCSSFLHASHTQPSRPPPLPSPGYNLDWGRGVAMHTQNAPSLSMATISCPLPRPPTAQARVRVLGDAQRV